MKIKITDANLFDSNDEIIITSIKPLKNELYLAGSKKDKNYNVKLMKIN